MADALVEFDSVAKRFGDFTAVETMNFTIDEGEFVAIMGPSGCGKTTTLRMLAGLEAPSRYSNAVNVDPASARIGYNICLCHAFPVRGVCYGGPGGDHVAWPYRPDRHAKRYLSGAGKQVRGGICWPQQHH